MLKNIFFVLLCALALPLCAQTPEYKTVQYSGYINRFYTLCFDTENMLWAGGPSNGLPYGAPNGVLLHRVDANLNLKAGRNFDAEPDIEYPAEIGWDAGDRIIGCGNYQDGGFGKGFVFRFRPQTTPSQLLFLKKIEGGDVRLSGLVENTADTSLLVYGTSLEGGVQRGELFRFQRNTGALRPGFPKRYSVGQGLSFDAAILHEGRLYTAGTCSLGGALGGNSTTFGLTCVDAASGEALWFASNPAPAGQAMHLEARDLIFTDDDLDALLIVGNGDDQHSPAQGSHIFLQKSALDGTLRWIKKIDLPDWTDEYAEEVVAVSDGYLIFGRSRNPAEQGVFLLKTDHDGKPKWAKRINRGTGTWLPDWPAQAQMLVRNEAIYLTCNALVTTGVLSPPNVGLLFKLQLDGTLANCSTVQPTPAVNLPFSNLSSIELGLSASLSPLQANTATGSVPTGISGSFGPETICQQTGYLCNDRPDLSGRLDSAYCSSVTGGLGAAIRLCNTGKTANAQGFYVSFYEKNPLSGPAKRVFTHRFSNQVDPNDCEVAQFALSSAFKNNTRYYTLVGADTNAKAPILLSNFPLPGGFPECDYSNNLDSFVLNLPPECFPSDCNPSTYLRLLGDAKAFQSVAGIRASGDGNLYMAGYRKDRPLITKMTPEGKFLWTRSFSIAPFAQVRLAEIIVDSEGMIVGNGGQVTGNNPRTLAFRYDPNTDQMLWIQLFESIRPGTSGILEKSPGGNYLLSHSLRLPEFLVFNTEILELDRTTGQIVPSFAKRYQHGYSEAFARMVMHDGALYATGFVDSVVNNELVRRMILTKMNPNTGEALWSRMAHMEWERPAYFQGYDLLVDDGHLLTMYYGSEETYRIHLGDGIPTYTFLQKSTLDGEVLWTKRYRMTFPKELAVVPDGYILSAGIGGHTFLKVDKNGNPVNAQRVTGNTGTSNASTQQQNRIERIGPHLFLTNHGTAGGGNYQHTILLKTDLNLNLEYGCNDYIPTTVPDSVPAVAPTTFPAPQTVRPSTATQQSPVPVFAPDTVVVQKTECPICPDSLCTDKPDITLRLDSITCHSPSTLAVHARLCNVGGAAPPTAFYLTFYDKNPLAGSATPLQTLIVEEKPDTATCVQIVLLPDTALLQHAKLYALAGVTGSALPPFAPTDFPMSGGYPECGYANNLDSFQIALPLDCTPDPDSCQPNTFLKISGKMSGFENTSALRAAPDGNLYMAGRKGAGCVIYKMTPNGKLLWAHSILAPGPQLGISVSEIIVDSEGMIVGAGRIVGSQFVSDKTLVFRFNPVTFQTLWARQIDSNRATEGGILEKTPGGNYLLYQNPDLPPLGAAQRAEVLELDRTTGQIMPSFANRYQHFQNQTIQSMVAHGGAIYATGYADTVLSGLGAKRRVLLTKLDASTGQVIWSRIGPKDWAEKAYYIGGDLIVDNNSLLMLYHGNETENSISVSGNQKIAPMFLQKTTLDGELLWVRKYMVIAFPRELLAVPDGYVLFGGYGNRYLLKTDKEGNLLVSKFMKSIQHFIIHDNDAENQMERIDSSLFIANNTGVGNQLGHYTTLLKTDLNLDMEFPCGLLPNPVQDSAVTNPANIAIQQAATPSPASQQGLTLTLAPDEMVVRENCPTCSDPVCTDKPDLTARVDSLTCLSAGAYAASVSVCNLGKTTPDTGFHLTFYDKNPLVGGAVALQSVFLEEKPDSGACVQAMVQLGAQLFQHAEIYTLVGADGNVPTPVSISGFPFAGGFAECAYTNNLDSFVVKKPDCGSGGGCSEAATFIKKLGSRLDTDLAFSICKTADGNLYLAGRKNPVDLFIAKMNPGGEVLWMRKIPAGAATNNLRISEIIEDSDGKIVFSATQGNTPSTYNTIAMRYDPAGDSLIWFKFVGAARPASTGILEKGPGGNFLLSTYIQVLSTGRVYTRIWEVERSTGEAVPGAIATDYEGGSIVRFERMLARQNSLYATGARQQSSGGPTRSILVKLDAGTGNGEWGVSTTPDSTSSTQPDVLHTDLEFDGDFALMTGSGLRNPANPAQGVFAYLEKHAPDGSLLWLKRYDVSMRSEDVLALPDAYVIFGKMADNRWGLLKTDKDGNPLIFKTLNTSTASLGNTLLANRQGQIFSTPDHLFMADYGPMSDDSSAIWLLKTDHNFDLDNACDLLQTASVQATTMPAKSALVLLTRKPFTPSIADAGVIYEKDSLQICGICPACPCCAPDLMARVDSIGCSFFDGTIAHVSVCNLGETTPDTGFHLTFYDKNPLVGGAVALQSVFLEEKPAPGACVQAAVPVDAALFQHPKIYTLVGVDKTEIPPFALGDFPFANGFAECNYANNLDSFATVLPPIQKLDLGPDRKICTGQTVTLDAGSGYVLYDWSTGPNTQTYTTGATGSFAVEVVDACGRKQRDTVQVTIFPYPKRTVNITLLPGDSVVIAGKTYKGTTTFVDTIPSLSGPCDTVATYHIRLDSLHCTGKASAFLQANYQENENFIGRVVLPASDGSIYTGGESHFLDWQFVLTKTAANGKVLWSRGFDFVNSSQNAAIIDHLIEDSEGKLVGTFTQLGATGFKIHFTAFRYDPQSDQMLWVKNVRTTEAASTPRILAETKAGGNFVVAYSLASMPQGTFSEVCELDRSTGNPVGNSARRYGPGVTFYGGAVHHGMLYANGLVRDTTTSSIAAKNGYVKIDLNTGQPIDQKILKTVSGGSVAGHAMAIDQDGHLVSLLFTADTTVWLRKTTLNGEVIWLKQYRINDLPLVQTNIIGISAVSDGYVVALEFFAANTQYIGSGLLKVDLSGNILWAKQFDALGVLWGRSPQIMQARGDQIYMTGALDVSIQTPAKTTGVLVAKLDKDGNAGQDCDFFKNISISVSDQVTTYEPAVVNVTTVGRLAENAPNGPQTDYDLDIYTRCSKCLDPCAITLALPPSLSLCPGDTLTLQAQEDFAEFIWQDGSTGSSLVVTQPGLYHVTVKDKCGAEQRDSVTVSSSAPPIVQKIVVLLPGESIVIAGNTYSAPAKFEVIIPSKSGICDTVAQYTVVVSPSGCARPRAFLKSFDGAQSRVIAADQNNGAYLLGESTKGTMLARFDSTGQLLWSRDIIKTLGGSGQYAYPVALIQDSDGMLMGCGNHSNSGQIVVFRYDPIAHQMLWLKTVQLDSNNTTATAHDILEEKQGGHFLLIAEYSETSMGEPFFKSEIMRLDRATGALIGPAKRYGLTRFREAVVQGNALYITGTLQNPSVANDHSGGFLKIDLTTDQVLWAKRMTLLWPNSYGGEDLLVDADGNIVSLLTRINEFVLQKISPDGNIIWQRKYTVDFPTTGGVFGYNIRLLPDGDYALALSGNFFSGVSILIAKIAKDGPVKWAKLHKGLWLYASPGTQWLDVRENTIYFTHGATEPYTTLFGKLDASGDISGACQLAEDIRISYASSFIGQIPSTPPVESRTKTLFAPSTSAPAVLDYKAKFRCIQCESICDTIRVTKTITFYPGDTITIDGEAYTQSGTVVQNFTTPAGCDSVVTNILQLVVTEVKMTCPANLTVTLPPNQTTTVVDYGPPTATTNCPDSTITLKLLQGPPVGGNFPQGATLVCYEAANRCGIRDTCCFSITAQQPDPPCDVKSPTGCIRYDLLGIRLDAQGQPRYRVRFTNTCASPLEFAYIQLPNGVLAVSPKEGVTYNTPGGNDYAVRNPNASPFYSVRYKAVAGSLNNGESDIFEYTLPQQSAPAYIRVAARLIDGTYSEAHLNTYNCPVLPYQGTGNRDMSGTLTPHSSLLTSGLSVWPNPTEGTLFVDVNGWQSQTLHLQVLNAQGQTVLSQQVWAENGRFELALPEGLASGLYYLRVVSGQRPSPAVSGQGPSPAAAAVRFVLER